VARSPLGDPDFPWERPERLGPSAAVPWARPHTAHRAPQGEAHRAPQGETA
jgi:hypothetical protein